MLSFQKARALQNGNPVVCKPRVGMQYKQSCSQMAPMAQANIPDQSLTQVPTFTLQQIRNAQAQQCRIQQVRVEHQPNGVIAPQVIRPIARRATEIQAPKRVKVRIVKPQPRLPKFQQVQGRITSMRVENMHQKVHKKLQLAEDNDLPKGFDFKKYMLAVHYRLEKKLNMNAISKASKAIQKKGFRDELRKCIKHNKSLKQFKCLSNENKRFQKQLMKNQINSQIKNEEMTLESSQENLHQPQLMQVQDQFIQSIQHPDLAHLKYDCLRFNPNEPHVEEDIEQNSRTFTDNEASQYHDIQYQDINEVLQDQQIVQQIDESTQKSSTDRDHCQHSGCHQEHSRCHHHDNHRLIDQNMDLQSLEAISQRLNSTSNQQYNRIEDVITEEFWNEMYAEYPRIKKSWGLKVIMGADFDPSETKYKESVPDSNEYIVFKFQKNSGVDSYLRLFQCKFQNCCHRVIQSPSKFYDHLRSHTRERPFVCHCGVAFVQRANLNKHQQHIHEGERPFECEDCGRRFSKKFNLGNHKKSCKKNLAEKTLFKVDQA